MNDCQAERSTSVAGGGGGGGRQRRVARRGAQRTEGDTQHLQPGTRTKHNHAPLLWRTRMPSAHRSSTPLPSCCSCKPPRPSHHQTLPRPNSDEGGRGRTAADADRRDRRALCTAQGLLPTRRPRVSTRPWVGPPRGRSTHVSLTQTHRGRNTAACHQRAPPSLALVGTADGHGRQSRSPCNMLLGPGWPPEQARVGRRLCATLHPCTELRLEGLPRGTSSESAPGCCGRG